jgi:hypothetical protein
LKFAIAQGLLRCDVPEGTSPNKRTKCPAKNLAAFFAACAWLQVKEQPWPEDTTT